MGTEQTGSKNKLGMVLGSTWGTAGTIPAAGAIEHESMTWGENAEKLTATPLGSGEIGPSDVQRGLTTPGYSGRVILGSNTEALVIPKQFFGAESVVSQASTWAHSLSMNETLNQSFITMAMQVTTQSLVEFVSGVVTKLSFDGKVGDYVRMGFDVLADQLKLTSQTNTYAVLEAATLANSERIVFQADDEFWINGQTSGALSASDRIPITDFSIQYMKDHEMVREAKGSAGNGEPVPSGNPILDWTITVTLARPQDLDKFVQMQAGSEYKARLSITGAIITGSIASKFIWDFPRLKQIVDPKLDMTAPGVNPLTLTFQGLVASSFPTGMISEYPWFGFVNNRATHTL